MVNGAALNNLAGVRLTQGNFDEADRLLAELSKKEGWSDNPTVLYNRAVIADKRGDFESVVSLLNRKDIVWQKPEARLLLEKALEMLGRSEWAN